MDKICNKSEVEDLSKTVVNTEEGDDVKSRSSPVFKCFNHTKATKGNHLDSSDCDIPSYQPNQSVKSRTSSKCANETSESVLPFSPIFSPIPVSSNLQFQPPSIHSVGTIVKNSHKSCQNKESTASKNAPQTVKPSGAYENLGMIDKDISWVSSMATPPPKQVPGSEFNTIEKATFFPEEKFQNIQPRALFSPTLDEGFGCQPIIFTSESEDNDDEEYKSNIRLSDVCATLKQLEVKSLELLDNSVDKILMEKDYIISPIIRTKKNKLGSIKKRTKGSLVISPENKDKYEFSVGENLKTNESEKINSNFPEDDSFQSMSFSGIDELCKTLVTEQSNTSAAGTSECDKTLINKTIMNKEFNTSKSQASEGENTLVNYKDNVKKKFYLTKATDVFAVLSMDNLHSYAKALEEGDKCNPVVSKIDEPLAEKGIIRLDVLNEETKLDSTKRLHSEISEENDGGLEKKIKKDDEDSGWENVKHYLSESQLNVSDGEIFRTVENLEKTLASQESKDLEKLSCDVSPDEETISQSSVKISTKVSGKSNTKIDDEDSNCIPKKLETSDIMPVVAFTTASGSKISVSEKAMNKAKEILRDCDENLVFNDATRKTNSPARSDKEVEIPTLEHISGSDDLFHEKMKGFSTGSGKQIKVSAEAMRKGKLFMSECEETGKVSEKCHAEKSKGKCEFVTNKISTDPEKSVQVMLEALEKPFMLEFEDAKEEPEGKPVMKGFVTGLGRKIQVSAEALEKAKTLMAECDKDLNCSTINSEEPSASTTVVMSESIESSKNKVSKTTPSFVGFSTCSGKKVQVSAKALEKAKSLMADCVENPKGDLDIFRGFSTGSGIGILASAESLEKAKAFMKKCEGEGMEISDKLASHWLVEMSDPTSTGQTEKIKTDPETSKVSFKTASGNKVDVSSKALKSAKEFWSKSVENLAERSEKTLPRIELPQMGFQTAGGNKVTVSETALAKAKQRMNDWDEINQEEFHSVKENTKTSIENVSEVTPKPEESGINRSDEWEEIIPSWLHVYSTSPSITSDRLELSPVVSHEDGKSSKSEREYIVKSPVLGASDRFHGRVRRRKLRFEEEKKVNKTSGFVVPYKNPDRKTCAKRTSNLTLDFSVPFKKIKFENESVTNVDVKSGRARAREEQEKAIKQKEKVKPLKGLHMNKKSTEKQISWKEAVAGSSPNTYSEEVLKSLGVNDDVLQINIENAEFFRFKAENFFGSICTKNLNGFLLGDGCVLILDDDDKFGVEEIKRAFLASPGVQPSLVPHGWVENHVKWIIWKLSHYEKSFPNYFGGKCLTPNQIMLQLKYRYDREIDRSERSALKKILERDDTSIKRLVLCVCGIKKVTTGDMVGYELKLTDGWYSCPAHSDPAMTRLIEEGKIVIGTKLLTQGAALVNCEQGVSPLEINEDVYLKISTNSTRRIRWDAKLGFQKNPENFPISLGSILPQGGQVSRIDVIIVRIYPTLYMEKTSDGRRVTRNRRSEEKAESEYRRLQEERMETICNEIQSEMKKSPKFDRRRNRLNNFEQTESMGSSSDSSTYQELNEKDRFSRELREKLEKEKLNRRNVSEFLRAKIVDFRKPDFNNPALLSVWNPNEDLTCLLTEGKVISLMNVTISNSSRIYKPLQINTTRQTQYRQITRNVKYPARKLSHLKDVSSKVCPAFEEVDVVGMITLIQDVSYGSRLSQVVYLTDLEMNFVGVVFWGSCKDYGWENVLRIPFIVACSNLQWKKNTHSGIRLVPSLYVSENSVFTESPKHVHLKEEIERLKKNMPQDKTEFLSKCEEELISKLEDAKWGFKSNLSANDSIVSETSKPRIVNGFESKPTASSTPIKPFTSRIASNEAEPSPIQKKIEKLQSYGEPPSLIPLLIRNNVKRKFKKKS